jgi:hypothetical protein
MEAKKKSIEAAVAAAKNEGKELKGAKVILKEVLGVDV